MKPKLILLPSIWLTIAIMMIIAMIIWNNRYENNNKRDSENRGCQEFDGVDAMLKINSRLSSGTGPVEC